MDNDLAIIIPAFKADFFDRTLKSISLQSNKNFTVYIGDDNSPYNLYTIVERYLDNFTIVYKKFDQNLGSISLISQWHRCIELADKEKWLWLFSDDDLMDQECVAAFYNTISIKPQAYDLYRFNTDMIDADDKLLYHNPIFDDITSSYNFANKKLKGEIRSFVSEYIFSKNIYDKQNGFVEFPLAWASDDATWIKFAFEKGIYTIPDNKVYWRLSNSNISNSGNNYGNEKCFALIMYSNWLMNFFKNTYDLNETKENLKIFFLNQLNHYKVSLSLKFVVFLYSSLKKTFDISYLQTSIYLIKNKIL